MTIIAELAKEFRFEAAHFLPNVPKTHKCHKMHGHSYVVTIRASGQIDEQLGWVMDLSKLSDAFSPLQKILDHSLLNDIEGLKNPTSENLALWIMTKLQSELPELSSVTVGATDRVSVTLRKQQ